MSACLLSLSVMSLLLPVSPGLSWNLGSVIDMDIDRFPRIFYQRLNSRLSSSQS
jgi:hypothetical protein